MNGQRANRITAQSEEIFYEITVKFQLARLLSRAGHV